LYFYDLKYNIKIQNNYLAVQSTIKIKLGGVHEIIKLVKLGDVHEIM